VTVTGTGFPPDSPVVAELFSDPVVLGSTAADANGAFRLVVSIPTTTSPGLHTLRVRTVDGAVAAETTLAVTGLNAAAIVPSVATGGGSLSRTGTDITGPGRLALGLVVAGFVLVGLSWRERSATLPARRPQGPGGRRRWP
jgi:alpha-L-fucosidase